MSRGTRPGGRWVFRPLCNAVLLTLALAAGPTGCALDAQPAFTGLSLTVTAPIVIPGGRAHAILQGGRLAGASSKLEPYCELEVQTVSGAEPQRITTGDFQVSRITSRLLLDPTTRIPAIFVVSSCSEPLFQELVWWLTSTEPSDVMFLRCIAPYYNCAVGPPLSPDQVQQQVGRYLAVRVADPAARLR
ncbi:MAG: hypothetical protein U9Q81_18750 [Pseudomonadota bacterium]|nr:hypothetical protein [Pseudomonadota bacterium]